MATSPVTLDFSKAQPVLDFSKAQPIEKQEKAEPTWWEHVKQILAPRPVPHSDNVGPDATNHPMPGSFEGHPENIGEYIPASIGEMGGGASDVLHGDVAKGLHRVIGGVGNAAMPFTPLLAAAAPAVAVRAAAGGFVGSKVASGGAELLGATPDQADLAGDVGGIVGGTGGAKFPLKSHASELFSKVTGAAKGLPVDVARPGNFALEAQELSKQGNSMPKVIRDFINRTTDPDKPPLTYEEARQFYSSAARLSANEASRLSPVMSRQVNKFRAALNESIADTADQAGKLDEYVDAMKEYRRASQIGDLSKAVATKVIPAGVATYVVDRLLKSKGKP